MKKWITFFKKCKKAFTLMECVCAIAVVGLLSALILPLTAEAMRSMRTSDALRTAASDASYQNATKKTSSSNGNYETMYVTIKYTNVQGMQAESAFSFTKSEITNGTEKVKVTYYDLKYGKEERDAS